MNSINILQLAAFLDLFAVGMIVPLIPNHTRQMGANHIYIGLLGSVYAAFQLASGPLIGSLSDLKGRRKILILTLLVCSLSYVLLGFTSSLMIILIMRAVLGVFKQTQLLTKALVPDYENNIKQQSNIYGRMAAISGAGMTMGPIIGGHIVEDFPQHGFTSISVIVGLCFIVNAGLVYQLPEVFSPKKKEKNASQISMLSVILNSSKQSCIELTKVEWSKYWKIFLFKALNSFAMSLYYSNYSIYLKTQYGLLPKNIGYIIGLQGIIGAISSFLIGYINSLYKNDSDFRKRNYHVFLVLSLSMIGLCMSQHVYMYIVFLVPLAIGNAVGRLVTLEMILRKCDKDHRGTLIGASNSVRSSTGVIAPMVSGFIGEIFGVQYVIYASLSSTLIGLVLSYYHNKEIKQD